MIQHSGQVEATASHLPSFRIESHDKSGNLAQWFRFVVFVSICSVLKFPFISFMLFYSVHSCSFCMSPFLLHLLATLWHVFFYIFLLRCNLCQKYEEQKVWTNCLGDKNVTKYWENARNPFLKPTVAVCVCLVWPSHSYRIIENAQFFILGHHGQKVESLPTRGPLRAPALCFSVGNNKPSPNHHHKWVV